MADNFPPGGANPFQPAPAAGQPPQTSGKAIASLVLGLCSFVMCFFTGIPAIIFGVLSLGDISRSNGRVGGRGMATAGIVLGAIGSMLSVIGILIALLLPAIQAAREAARRNQSSNKLKQVGLALQNYHDVYRSFPAAGSKDDSDHPLLSWRVAVLPYLEETALLRQFHQDEPWDSADNEPLLDACPDTYLSPGDMTNDGTETNVLGIVGPDSVLAADNPVMMKNITDGTSKTIVAVELAGAGIPWTEPRDITVDELLAAIQRGPNETGLRRVYIGGVLCMFADGSVHFLSEDIDPATLRWLCTKSGGEPASVPDF